jgi:hypothetical protein
VPVTATDEATTETADADAGIIDDAAAQFVGLPVCVKTVPPGAAVSVSVVEDTTASTQYVVPATTLLHATVKTTACPLTRPVVEDTVTIFPVNVVDVTEMGGTPLVIVSEALDVPEIVIGVHAVGHVNDATYVNVVGDGAVQTK